MFLCFFICDMDGINPQMWDKSDSLIPFSCSYFCNLGHQDKCEKTILVPSGRNTHYIVTNTFLFHISGPRINVHYEKHRTMSSFTIQEAIIYRFPARC